MTLTGHRTTDKERNLQDLFKKSHVDGMLDVNVTGAFGARARARRTSMNDLWGASPAT